MRTIWKMSSAEPAANYPPVPSTSARGLHPVQAAGDSPDFMVDDEDDGFDWDFAQPPERTAAQSNSDAVVRRDPDPSQDVTPESAEPDVVAAVEPEPQVEAALIGAAARADAEQPKLAEPPKLAAPAEQALLAEQPIPAERTRASGKAPSWLWPAAMALLVAAVVALLFVVREQMDAPRPPAAPEFVAEEPFEPAAGFPSSPVFEPEPPAPLPQVQAAPPPAKAPVAAPAAPRTAPPKQKATAATQNKRQRPPRRAQAQQPAAAPADAISCILPGGQEVQTSYPSCRARGGVIYR
jgi:hypothetical protein